MSLWDTLLGKRTPTETTKHERRFSPENMKRSLEKKPMSQYQMMEKFDIIDIDEVLRLGEDNDYGNCQLICEDANYWFYDFAPELFHSTSREYMFRRSKKDPSSLLFFGESREWNYIYKNHLFQMNSSQCDQHTKGILCKNIQTGETQTLQHFRDTTGGHGGHFFSYDYVNDVCEENGKLAIKVGRIAPCFSNWDDAYYYSSDYILYVEFVAGKVKVSKGPGFVKKMGSKNAETDLIRSKIFKVQKPEDDTYGYSINNPVCSATADAAKKYLARLRTEKKEALFWVKTDTTVLEELAGIKDVEVDTYQLYLHGQEYKEIYICPYGLNSTYVPRGLSLIKEKEVSGTGGELDLEAKQKGVSADCFLEMQRLEYEIAQQAPEKASEQQENIWRETAKEETILVQKSYPAFNLKDVEEDARFLQLVNNAVDIKTAYEYLHCEELFDKKVFSHSEANCAKKIDFDTAYSLLFRHEATSIHLPDEQEKTTARFKLEAAQNNLTTDQYAYLLMLQAEEARAKNCKALAEQVIRLQTEYPSFSLEKELKNAKFAQLMIPVGMKAAYEITHFSELFSQKHQVATAETAVEQLFCRKCGTKLPTDSRFCYKCGTEIICDV